MASPRIVLLAATQRGVRFAHRLFELCPEGEFVVCSFPEEPWEPRYLAELEQAVAGAGQRLHITRQFSATELPADGRCDLLIAVSWRYLVKRDAYGRAQRGAFVFHDSLLPKYRGFSPTPWAIINGERETGVTLLDMAESPDTGGIVDQVSVPIGPQDYVETVLGRVTEAYLRVLERNLPALLAGTAPRRVQNEAEATYCCRRRPDDNRIDWHAPAGSVFNLIRACSAPYPGAYCCCEGKRLTIWAADPPDRSRRYVGAVPGRIVERVPGQGVRVLAGDHSLLLRSVQSEGGAVQPADELLSKLAAKLT